MNGKNCEQNVSWICVITHVSSLFWSIYIKIKYIGNCKAQFWKCNNLNHYVMENGENQHTFIRRSEIAFPIERHSVVKWDSVKRIWWSPCLTVSHVSRQCSTLKDSVWFCTMISYSTYFIFFVSRILIDPAHSFYLVFAHSFYLVFISMFFIDELSFLIHLH